MKSSTQKSPTAPSGTLNSALVVRTSSLEPTSGRLRRSSFAGGRGSLPQSHPPLPGLEFRFFSLAPSSAPSVSLQTRGGPCGPPWNVRASPVLLFSRLPDDRKDALLPPWTPSLSPSRQDKVPLQGRQGSRVAFQTHPRSQASSRGDSQLCPSH